MNFRKYKILLIPPAFLLSFFALDKVLLIEGVRERIVSWKKIEPVFYETRETVFTRLVKEYPARDAKGEKLGLILGSSRSGAFDARYIAEKLPGYYVYNFSAPFAGPSFYYYMLTRVPRNERKVQFVIMETGPLLFASAGIEYSLAYSYSPGFVARHFEYGRKSAWQAGPPSFRLAEAETYFLKRLFAAYRYPLDLGVILENNSRIRIQRKEGGTLTVRKYYLKNRLTREIRRAARENLGGIPNPAAERMSPEKLRDHARLVERTYFKAMGRGPDFHGMSRTQALFFRGSLELLARNKIPLLLYWPVSAQPYREMLKRRGLLEPFQKHLRGEIARVQKQYPNFRAVLVDPHTDPSLKCRDFEDSYHLSGACFPGLTNRLLERLPVTGR